MREQGMRPRLQQLRMLLGSLQLLASLRSLGSQCEPGTGCPADRQPWGCQGAERNYCEVCEPGVTFSPGEQLGCLFVTKCPPGQGVLEPSTNTTDTVCVDCVAPHNYSAEWSAVSPCLPTGSCRPGEGVAMGVAVTNNANISCAACPRGKYSDQFSQAPCENCAENEGTEQHGGTACVCAPGYSRSASGECTACLAGYYKEIVADGACSECPEGTVPPGAAGEIPTLPQATTTLDACSCAVGRSGRAGTGCRLCPPGRYKSVVGEADPESGLSGCSTCPSGYVTDTLSQAGASSCTRCEIGQYSEHSHVACSDCLLVVYEDTLPSQGGMAHPDQCLCPAGRHLHIIESPLKTLNNNGDNSGNEDSTWSPNSMSVMRRFPQSPHSRYPDSSDLNWDSSHAAAMSATEEQVFPLTSRKVFRAPNAATTEQRRGLPPFGRLPDDECRDCPRYMCQACPASRYSQQHNLTGMPEAEVAQRLENGCSSCPPDSTTFGTGASSIDACKCILKGYEKNEAWHGNSGAESDWACATCPSGRYKSVVGDYRCVQCPQNSSWSGTQVDPADTPEVCICNADAGYIGEIVEEVRNGSLVAAAGGCTLCTAGTLNAGGECTECATHAEVTQQGECMCLPGYRNSGTDPPSCEACAAGQFMNVVSEAYGSSSATECDACDVDPYQSSCAGATDDAACGDAVVGYPSMCTWIGSCIAMHEAQCRDAAAQTDCEAAGDCVWDAAAGTCTAQAKADCEATAVQDSRSDCVGVTVGNSTVPACTFGGSCGLNPSRPEQQWSGCILCVAGKQASNSACEDCPPGRYKQFSGPEACTACPSHSFSTNGDQTQESCQCAAGFTKVENSCTPCAAGKYKSEPGDGACTDCPPTTVASPTGSDAEADCPCAPGYQFDGTSCVECPVGHFKHFSGPAPCEDCVSGNHVADEVAFTSSGANIRPHATGQLVPALCEPCIVRWRRTSASSAPSSELQAVYADATRSDECTPYAVHSSSVIYPSLGVLYNTTCTAGQYRIGDECADCPEGKYATARAGGCRVCPAGSTSPAGSTTLGACECLPGLVQIQWKEVIPLSLQQLRQLGPSLSGSTSNVKDVWRCVPCGPGRYPDSTGTCSFCPLDHYSIGWPSNGSCTPCPAHSTTEWVPTENVHSQWTYMEGLDAEPKQRFVRRQNYENSVIFSENPIEGRLADGISACYCKAGYTGEITRATHTCTLCEAGEYGVTGRSLSGHGEQRPPISPVLGKFDPDRNAADGQSTCELCEQGRYKSSSGSTNALMLAEPGATDCAEVPGAESPLHYTADQIGGNLQVLDPCYRAVTILAGSFDRLGGDLPGAQPGTRLQTGNETDLVVSFSQDPGYPVEYWDGATTSILSRPHGCSTTFESQFDAIFSMDVVNMWRAQYNNNANDVASLSPDASRMVCAMDLIPEISVPSATGRKIFTPQLLSAWGQCRPCPPNTATIEPGATGIDQCVCKSGTYGVVDPADETPFFDEGDILVPVCRACPAGRFSAANSANCTVCQSGRYASPPTSAMGLDPVWGVALEFTSYVMSLKAENPAAKSPDIGASECTICPANSHTLSEGADSHIDCICNKGFHGVVDSPNSRCRACAVGRYGKGGLLDGAERPCEYCPDGRYSDQIAQAECLGLCPAGTGSTPGGTNASDCVECETGRVSSFGGGCVFCPVGRIANGDVPRLFSTCALCAPGRFALHGDSNCTACPPGRSDADRNPATLCTDCAVGKASDQEATVACTACLSGQEAKPGSLYCSWCKAGRYDQDLDARSYCIKCPKATYSDEEGATECKQCHEGKYSRQGGLTSLEQCQECPSGRWSFGSAISCTDCEPGTYRNSSVCGPPKECSKGCVVCDESAGLVCPLPGMIRPWLMPGYYMLDGDVEAELVAPVKCTPPSACFSYSESDKSCAYPIARDEQSCTAVSANPYGQPLSPIWSPASCTYPYTSDETACNSVHPSAAWNEGLKRCEFPQANDENTCIDLVRPAVWNVDRAGFVPSTSEWSFKTYLSGTCEYPSICSEETCTSFAGAGSQSSITRTEWYDPDQRSWYDSIFDIFSDEAVDTPEAVPACIFLGANTSQDCKTTVQPAVWNPGFCSFPSRVELNLMVKDVDDQTSIYYRIKKQYLRLRQKPLPGYIFRTLDGANIDSYRNITASSSYFNNTLDQWHVDEKACISENPSDDQLQLNPPGVWRSAGTIQKELHRGNPDLAIGSEELRPFVQDSECCAGRRPDGSTCKSDDFTGCRPSCFGVRDGMPESSSPDFLLFTPEDTPENAEQWCVERGGHLASIHSNVEYETLAEYIAEDMSAKFPWLGGYNCASELQASDEVLCGIGAPVRLHQRFNVEVIEAVKDIAECCNYCKQHELCGAWSFHEARSRCELKRWDDTESPAWTRALCLAVPAACTGSCSDSNAQTEAECLSLGTCSDGSALTEATCAALGMCENPVADDRQSCEGLIPPAKWTPGAAVWTSSDAVWTPAEDETELAELKLDFGDEASGYMAVNETEQWVSGAKILAPRSTTGSNNAEFKCSWRDGTPWDWQDPRLIVAQDVRANDLACLGRRKATVIHDVPATLLNAFAGQVPAPLELYKGETVVIVDDPSFRSGVGSGVAFGGVLQAPTDGDASHASKMSGSVWVKVRLVWKGANETDSRRGGMCSIVHRADKESCEDMIPFGVWTANTGYADIKNLHILPSRPGEQREKCGSELHFYSCDPSRIDPGSVAPDGAHCPAKIFEDGSQAYLPGVGNRWLDWCASLNEVSNAADLPAKFNEYCRQRGICRIDGGGQKFSTASPVSTVVQQQLTNSTLPLLSQTGAVETRVGCTVASGRAVGGDSRFVGFMGFASECENHILVKIPGATSMSFSPLHGDCVAGFGSTHRDADSGWLSCHLNKASPVSMGSTASQSGTVAGAFAGRAVDGIVDGIFAHDACALVGPFTPAEGLWWQVDLGDMVRVDSVDVYHRTDAGSGQLHGASILVSSNSLEWRECGSLVAAGGYDNIQPNLDVFGRGSAGRSSSFRRTGKPTTPLAVPGTVVIVRIAWLGSDETCLMLSPTLRGDWTYRAGDDVCIIDETGNGQRTTCRPIYRRRNMILAWHALTDNWKIGLSRDFDESSHEWKGSIETEWIASAPDSVELPGELPGGFESDPVHVKCIQDLSQISSTPGCACTSGSSTAEDVSWSITVVTSFWEDTMSRMPLAIGGPESVVCSRVPGLEPQYHRYVKVQFASTETEHPVTMAVCEVVVWGLPKADSNLSEALPIPREVGCIAKAKANCLALGGAFGPSSGSCYRLTPVQDNRVADDVCSETYTDARLASIADTDDYDVLAGLAISTGIPIPILIAHDPDDVPRVSTRSQNVADGVVIGYTSFEEVSVDDLRHFGVRECAAWRTEMWSGVSNGGPPQAVSCQEAPLHVVVERPHGLQGLAGRAEHFTMRWSAAVVLGATGMETQSTYRFNVRTVSAIRGSTRLLIDQQAQELLPAQHFEANTVQYPGVPDGWVVVLKTAANSDVFRFNSLLWSNSETLNPGSARSEPGDAKYPEYNTLSFTAIMGCVGDLNNCFAPQQLVRPVASAAEVFGVGDVTSRGRRQSIGRHGADDFAASFNAPVCEVPSAHPGYLKLCNNTEFGSARWGFCSGEPRGDCAGAGRVVVGFGLQGGGDNAPGAGAGVIQEGAAVKTNAWVLVRPTHPLPSCIFIAGNAVGLSVVSVANATCESDTQPCSATSAQDCARLVRSLFPLASGVTWIPGAINGTGECFSITGMTGREPSTEPGVLSCRFHGEARDMYADISVPLDTKLSIQVQASFGDVTYSAGAQLTVTPLPAPGSAPVQPGWLADLSGTVLPGAGVAGLAGWGFAAQAAMYVACTNGRNELGFRTDGNLDNGASVIGVIDHEWSSAEVSAADGLQYFVLSRPHVIEIGPVNIAGYSDVIISIWVRTDMSEGEGRVFAHSGDVSNAFLDSPLIALQSGWSEHSSERLDPGTTVVTVWAGAEWTDGVAGTVSFDQLRVRGIGPPRLQSRGCFYSDEPAQRNFYALGALGRNINNNYLLAACSIPTALPNCKHEIGPTWSGEPVDDVPDAFQHDTFYVGGYADTDVISANLTCISNAEAFGVAYKHYRLKFGANACINSLRLLDNHGAAVLDAELKSSPSGWNVTASATIGDPLNAISQTKWLCASATTCDQSNPTEAWVQVSVPQYLWPLYVSDYEIQTNVKVQIALEAKADSSSWVPLDTRDSIPFREQTTPLLSLSVDQAEGLPRVTGSAAPAFRLMGRPTVMPGPFGANDALFFSKDTALGVEDNCAYVARGKGCTARVSQAGSSYCGVPGALPQRQPEGNWLFDEGLPDEWQHAISGALVDNENFDNLPERADAIRDCNARTVLLLRDTFFPQARYSVDGVLHPELQHNGVLYPISPPRFKIAFEGDDLQQLHTLNGFYIQVSETAGRPDIERLHLEFWQQDALVQEHAATLQPSSVAGSVPLAQTEQNGVMHGIAAGVYALPGLVEVTHVVVNIQKLRSQWRSSRYICIGEMGFVWDPQVDKHTYQEQRGWSKQQCEAACDEDLSCQSFEFGVVGECPMGLADLRTDVCRAQHPNATTGLELWLPFVSDRHDRSMHNYSIDWRHADAERATSWSDTIVKIPRRPPYGSLKFDGSSHLEIRDAGNEASVVTTDTEGTLSAWILSSAFGSNHYQAVVATGLADGDNRDAALVMAVSESGRLNCGRWESSDSNNGEITIPRGTWTHVACVYTDTTLFRYVDGRPDRTSNRDEFAATAGTFVGGGPILYTSSGGDRLRGFVGNIGDVRVYSRGLAPAEIRMLWQESSMSHVTVEHGLPTVDSICQLSRRSTTWHVSDAFALHSCPPPDRELEVYSKPIEVCRRGNSGIWLGESWTLDAYVRSPGVATLLGLRSSSAVATLMDSSACHTCAPQAASLLPLGIDKVFTQTRVNSSVDTTLTDWTPVMKVEGNNLPYEAEEWTGNGNYSVAPGGSDASLDPGTAVYTTYKTLSFNSIMLCVQPENTDLADLSSCLPAQDFAPSIASAAVLFNGEQRSTEAEDSFSTAFDVADACPSYAAGINIACPGGVRVRWGVCAPSALAGCTRTHVAESMTTAGLGVSGAGTTRQQMWVLVRQREDPWRRLQVVSHPERVEMFVDGVRTYTEPRTTSSWSAAHRSFSTLGNSRHFWSGWGYLSQLSVYPGAWGAEDIAAETHSCRVQPSMSVPVLQSNAESCTWGNAQLPARESSAFIVGELMPFAVQVSDRVASGLFALADEATARKFRIGDSVHLTGTGWCARHAGRYKVQCVGRDGSCAADARANELALDQESFDSIPGEQVDSDTACAIGRPFYVSSRHTANYGFVDFPSISPPVERGREEVMFVHRLRFNFSYHVYKSDGVSSLVLDPPLVLVLLVAKDGREHVVYTSQPLSGCMEPGLPSCIDNMISVDVEVSNFFSPSFHVRLKIVSNDFSVEVTGTNGHPVQVETMLCKGMRPSAAGSIWPVARQRDHWGSEQDGFLHTGGLSFFPSQSEDTMTMGTTACGGIDQVRAESRANIQYGIVANGHVALLPHGMHPAEGQHAVQVFSTDITRLLDEWIRMPEHNDGVRMVPRGVGMYRLECSVQIAYAPQKNKKAPLCRSSACAPGYEGDRCSLCTAPQGTKAGFYRDSRNTCQPCPTDFTTFLYVGAIVGLFLIVVGVKIARKLRDVKDLGLKLAPMMIWVAFAQTVGMLLDFDIEWPPICQRIFEYLGTFSFSLQILRPECVESAGGERAFDFAAKIELFIWLPFYIFVIVLLFYGWAMHRNALAPLFSDDPEFQPEKFENGTGKQTCWVRCKCGPCENFGKKISRWCGKRKIKLAKFKPPPKEEIVSKIAAVLAGSFQLLSTPYLRMVCQGFDCSEVAVGERKNSTGIDSRSTRRFVLETEPGVECCYVYDYEPGTMFGWPQCGDIGGSERFRNIQTAALSGLAVYLVLLGYFVYMLKTNASHHKLDFVAAKMDTEWYWYELVLIMRRTLISLACLFSSDQQNLARGWLMCVLVLVMALTLQVYAQPYRDGADDLCEFLSLLATLTIYISGGAVVLGDGDAADTNGGQGGFERFIGGLVLTLVIAQTLICVVVQSVTVGVAKVEKLTIVHLEINVDSNESKNIDVLARLCRLACKRDSELYCPGIDLLRRVWLREGGLGDELDMDEEDIAAIMHERGGEIRVNGLEMLHNSNFAKFWQPATLDDPTPIEIVTPCVFAAPGGDRSAFLNFQSLSDHVTRHKSAKGVQVLTMNPTELPRAFKHRLLASGMAMDDVEQLDARLARMQAGRNDADGACTTTNGSILINLRCRFEWATLRPSDDQLRYIQDLHAALCEALKVRGATQVWDHKLPEAATEGSDIRILSVHRGPDEDIIRKSIAFVMELVGHLVRLIFMIYIYARYNRCVCCMRCYRGRKLQMLRIMHNEIVTYLGKNPEERDPADFQRKISASPGIDLLEEEIEDDSTVEDETPDLAAEGADADGKKTQAKHKTRKKTKHKKQKQKALGMAPPKNSWVQAFDPATGRVYFFNVIQDENGDHATTNFNPNNWFVKVCCRITRKSAVVGQAAGKSVVSAGKQVYGGSKKAIGYGYRTSSNVYHRIRPPKDPSTPLDGSHLKAPQEGLEREWTDRESSVEDNPLFGFGQPSGASDQPIDRLFAQMDKDDSGEIEFDEFIQWYETTIGGSDLAREIFDEIDEDGTGVLDIIEFRMILTEIAEADWVAATDNQTGRPYYVNVKTRITRWNPPGEAELNDWLVSMLRLGGDTDSRGDVPADPGDLSPDALFDAVDSDGSGEVSFSELATWWKERQRALGKPDDGSLHKMEEIFDDLDEDGSGTLNREEFKMILVEVVMDEWTAARDEVSDEMYYVNKATRETRWVPPGDADVDQWLLHKLDNGNTREPGPTHVDTAILSVDALFDLVDTDASGSISFDEFRHFWRERLLTTGKSDDGMIAKAEQIFADLDDDCSGILDRVEFRVIIAELAASDWTPAVDRASGRTYYINLKTRATRWALPEDEEADEFVKEHLGGGGLLVVDSSAATNSSAPISRVLASHDQSVAGSSSTDDVEHQPQHLDSAVLTVDGLFSAVDVDGSGEISFAEFADFWNGRQRAIGKHDDGSIAQLRTIFSDLDEDGSGALWPTRPPLSSLGRSCAAIAAGCMERPATTDIAGNANLTLRLPVIVAHALEQVILIVLSSRRLWSSSPAPNGSLPEMLQAAACTTCTRRHAKRDGFRPMLTTQIGSSLNTLEVRPLRLTVLEIDM